MQISKRPRLHPSHRSLRALALRIPPCISSGARASRLRVANEPALRAGRKEFRAIGIALEQKSERERLPAAPPFPRGTHLAIHGKTFNPESLEQSGRARNGIRAAGTAARRTCANCRRRRRLRRAEDLSLKGRLAAGSR